MVLEKSLTVTSNSDCFILSLDKNISNILEQDQWRAMKLLGHQGLPRRGEMCLQKRRQRRELIVVCKIPSASMYGTQSTDHSQVTRGNRTT